VQKVESSRLKVGEDDVHLWFAAPEDLENDELLTQYRQLLSPAEIRRLEAFRFEKDQLNFLVAHALVRIVLSRYSSQPAAELEFVPNHWGRPEVAYPPHIQLKFSLSRSKNLVLCGVTATREIGVDVEHTEWRSPLDVADRFFAPTEISELRKLPAESQRSRFFDYWTLKESYIKARGMGLSIPLDKFSFDLRRESHIRLAVDPELGGEGDDWGFLLLQAGRHHRVAVAVRRRPGGQIRWRAWKSAPLKVDRPLLPSVRARTPDFSATPSSST